MRRAIATLAWRAFALVCVALGAVGVVLPVLPTVPFLLLAAWAARRGWPSLEARLLAHPTYGPPIRRWQERGVVPRRAKVAASVGMGASVAIVAASGAPAWLKLGVPTTLAVVAVWLWRRPEA